MKYAGLAWVIAALGACSQPLTTGNGGTGGSPGSAPGTGGGAPSSCDALVAQYAAAVAAARTCTPGSPGQCQQVVDENLAVCGSCQINVNDASQTAAIEQAWRAAGCADRPDQPPCGMIACQSAVTDVCVAASDGKGTCSSALDGPKMDASAASTSDAGIDDCSSLSAAFAQALADAKRCDLEANVAPCGKEVSTSLDPCVDCTTFVTDSTALDAIQRKWFDLGCAGPMDCPIWYCAPAVGGMCVPTDGGAPACQTTYAPVTP